MKKYILSALVVVAFLSYAGYLKTREKSVAEPSVVEVVEMVVPKTPVATTTKPVTKPITPPVAVVPKPVPAPTPTPTPVPVVPTPPPVVVPKGQYKDGTYVGDRVYNYHGYIQVQAIIAGGKITDVQFLEYPNSGDSRSINRRAMPKLTQEAIVAQSAKVDTISGATDTSGAFRTSLKSALSQAVNV
jgi:uncharacterized protein with FMN-binding domain